MFHGAEQTIILAYSIGEFTPNLNINCGSERIKGLGYLPGTKIRSNDNPLTFILLGSISPTSVPRPA